MRVKAQNFPDSSQKGFNKIPLSTLDSWMSTSTAGETSPLYHHPSFKSILVDIPAHRLDEEEGRQTGGHKQMVQLDKRVKTSFQW